MQEVVKKAGLPWTAAKGLDVRDVAGRSADEADILPRQRVRAEGPHQGSDEAAFDAQGALPRLRKTLCCSGRDAMLL